MASNSDSALGCIVFIALALLCSAPKIYVSIARPSHTDVIKAINNKDAKSLTGYMHPKSKVSLEEATGFIELVAMEMGTVEGKFIPPSGVAIHHYSLPPRNTTPGEAEGYGVKGTKEHVGELRLNYETFFSTQPISIDFMAYDSH